MGGGQRVAQRVTMTIKHGDIRTIKMVAAESSNGRSNGRDNGGRDHNVIPDLVMVLMVLKVLMVLNWGYWGYWG